MTDQPTIVLVHGALTDASVWREVVADLHHRGHPVLAPAIGLRGLGADAEYLAAFLQTIDGPVVLAGHSYAGSVISHPALAGSRVRALVFVSAFAPDSGESTGELNARWPGSRLGEATTVVRHSPAGDELYLRPEAFGEVYAADLDPEAVAVLAATQRPIAVAALGEAFAGAPTWRRVPAWALISTEDHSLPGQAQRAMARRAAAVSVEVPASHATPLSQAAAVSTIIHRAATAMPAAPAGV